MKTEKPKPKADEIEELPDAWERFERAVDVVMKSPPKHQSAPQRKPKERPASKGRVHKAKSRP
jgi:hypothetical protein